MSMNWFILFLSTHLEVSIAFVNVFFDTLSRSTQHLINLGWIFGPICFAKLILRSANNYKEDAILIALLLVPPHLTSQTVSLSEKIGTSIKHLIVSDKKNVMVN